MNISVFCPSRQSKSTPKSGLFRKLLFKYWKRPKKRLTRGVKRSYFSLFISSVKVSWKGNLNFLWNFKIYIQQRSLSATQFRLNSRLKKALWYMAFHNETILRERTIISTKHRPKNILGQMKRRILRVLWKQATWVIWAGWPENTDPRSVDQSNGLGPRFTSRIGPWTTYTDHPYWPPQKFNWKIKKYIYINENINSYP